jgi:hypothetical protein
MSYSTTNQSNNDQNSSLILIDNNNQTDNTSTNHTFRLHDVFSDLTNQNNNTSNQSDEEENDDDDDDEIEYINENQENNEPQNDDIDDSYAEFRPKIRRLNSNSDVKSASNTNKTKQEEDSACAEEEVCSICLEAWTNSGSHRLVCLKCGHLFGEACIDKWIKSNPKCPQCNRPSKRTDIRRLYSKSIKVIDTAELDKALRDVDTERQLRKRAEIEVSELKLRFQLLRDELTAEKEKHKNLMEKFKMYQQSGMMPGLQVESSNNSRTSNNSGDKSTIAFSLEKMFNLTEVNLNILTIKIHFLTLNSLLNYFLECWMQSSHF